MAKCRARDLMKEFGIGELSELIALAANAGVTIKNQMTAIEEEDYSHILSLIERLRRDSVVEKRVAGGVIRRRVAARPHAPHPAPAPEPETADETAEFEEEATPAPEVPAPAPEPAPVPAPTLVVHETPEPAAPAAAPAPEPVAKPEPVVHEAPEPVTPVVVVREAPAPVAPIPAPAVPAPAPETSPAIAVAPTTPTPPAPVAAAPAVPEPAPIPPEEMTEGMKRGFRKPRQISTIVKRIDLAELLPAQPPPRAPRPPFGQGPMGSRPPFGQGSMGPRRPQPGQRPMNPASMDIMPPPDPNQVGRRRTVRLDKTKTDEESGNRNARGKRQAYEDSVNERRLRSGGKRKDRHDEINRLQQGAVKAGKRVIKLGSDSIIVSELAKRMGIKANELILKLIQLGLRVNINQAIDLDTATLVAAEFGFEVENVAFEEENWLPSNTDDAAEHLVARAPVVTVMGHVDHGKTSILDYIRKSQVAAGEAGGITQHIGAYMVHREKGDITFIDTPGHAAFTAMRARGAQITDIVVLVVAADDGVMPQTVEAINHARGAKVPIIVAVNKMDKPQANPARVQKELIMHGLVPEDLGGDIIMVPVSAKSGMGIDQLLEMILLQAEVLELKANPSRAQVDAVVIEAKLDRGRGPVATVLMRHGTLKVGDYFVCGAQSGRVKALINDAGQRVEQATPSMPVEVLGFEDVPAAGEVFNSMSDEKQAKVIAENRYRKKRDSELAKTSRVSLEELVERVKAGDMKTLSLVVKGDVQGTVGALRDSLAKLGSDEVKIEIIHAGVGGITESDVLFATASKALIIGFNVRPETKAQILADKEGVEIKVYSIIYDVLEDIKAAVLGLTKPTIREEILGHVEVRDLFVIPKVGTIAGCYVLDGKITRQSQLRVLRDNIVIFTGRIGSLRRFKDDAAEVQSGYECGVGFDNYNDLKVGDILEPFVTIEERAGVATNA